MANEAPAELDPAAVDAAVQILRTIRLRRFRKMRWIGVALALIGVPMVLLPPAVAPVSVIVAGNWCVLLGGLIAIWYQGLLLSGLPLREKSLRAEIRRKMRLPKDPE